MADAFEGSGDGKRRRGRMSVLMGAPGRKVPVKGEYDRRAPGKVERGKKPAVVVGGQ